MLPIVVFVLYCSWNYNRTGSSDFSSIQNINLLEWNLKYFHQQKFGFSKAKQINTTILQEASLIPEYAKRQKFIKTATIGYLKEDLLGYGIFHLKGCVRIFVDPGRFDLVNFFNFPSKKNEFGLLYHLNENGIKGALKFLGDQPKALLITLFLILLFNLLKVVSFIWFWIINYKKTNLILLFILFIILYIIFLTGPLGASRFFVPVLPAYLLFSSIGFVDLIKRLRKKTRV
ncbi:hypothetical protein GCM10022393_16240 [Aquimarina addita]|uniref:Uncharacterized protein n=1 Tax=Aquimarina addita TaxID=870485 RepID=A0ABP7XHI1_9FLAO